MSECRNIKEFQVVLAAGLYESRSKSLYLTMNYLGVHQFGFKELSKDDYYLQQDRKLNY